MNIFFYGACGRHNFGDLLFPHILLEVFKINNILYDKITFCDILERDMSLYGGHEVKSISRIFNENIDCIFMIGGEVYHCDIDSAINMFDIELDENNNDIDIIKKNIKNPIYLIDKELLKNKNTICIANSIGGTTVINDFSENKLLNYDYVSTRDSCYNRNLFDITPDCAILTKLFFDNKINSFKNNFNFMKNKYIAIQINTHLINTIDINNFINIQKYFNLPIYFFVAGIAKGHDDFKNYNDIIENNDNMFIFEETNIWKICCLIANSYITIGTSLHVRILSFCYSTIRFTLTNNNTYKTKHFQFIDKWDNIENSYLETTNFFDKIKIMFENNNINIFFDNLNINKAINEYILNSKKWVDIIKKSKNNLS